VDYDVDMVLCDTIYIPSLMKNNLGVQAILRFSLRNLRGYNVDITDLWDL
jgi:hypothetical protein